MLNKDNAPRFYDGDAVLNPQKKRADTSPPSLIVVWDVPPKNYTKNFYKAKVVPKKQLVD